VLKFSKENSPALRSRTAGGQCRLRIFGRSERAPPECNCVAVARPSELLPQFCLKGLCTSYWDFPGVWKCKNVCPGPNQLFPSVFSIKIRIREFSKIYEFVVVQTTWHSNDYCPVALPRAAGVLRYAQRALHSNADSQHNDTVCG